jgi:hypothetical protein
MSNLGCICGSVIRDNTDAVPNKGHLVPDPRFHDLVEAIRKEVQDFFAGGPVQPNDEAGKILAEDRLHFVIARNLMQYTTIVYQCTTCGRIHVQRKDDPNRFDPFMPDQPPHRQVL